MLHLVDQNWNYIVKKLNENRSNQTFCCKIKKNSKNRYEMNNYTDD